jgi:polyhydroxyalkanoate synthesis repressor PhaR
MQEETHAQEAEMNPVVIKRYDGVRLYDTEKAHYVTIEDLARMVLSGERFAVKDASTGEDVTKEVLSRLH